MLNRMNIVFFISIHYSECCKLRFIFVASDAAIDTEVKNVDKKVVKETSSSHISTVSSTGSCNKDDQPTPDDIDGNNVRF